MSGIVGNIAPSGPFSVRVSPVTAPAPVIGQVAPVPVDAPKLRHIASTCTIELDLEDAQQAKLTALYNGLKDSFGANIRNEDFAVSLTGRYITYNGVTSEQSTLTPDQQRKIDEMFKIADKRWGGGMSTHVYESGSLAPSRAPPSFIIKGDAARGQGVFDVSRHRNEASREAVKLDAGEQIRVSLLARVTAQIATYTALLPGADHKKQHLPKLKDLEAQLTQALPGNQGTWDEYALWKALEAREAGSRPEDLYADVNQENEAAHKAYAEQMNNDGIGAKIKNKMGRGVEAPFDRSYAVDVAGLLVAGNTSIDRRTAYCAIYNAHSTPVRGETPMHKMMGYLDGTLTNDAVPGGGRGKLDNLATEIFGASGLPQDAVHDLMAGWDSAALVGGFRAPPAVAPLDANPLLT